MSISETSFVRRVLSLIEFLHRENLFRLALVIVVLVLGGALGLTFFEPERNFLDSLWWAIVTLTTVGFGDIFPTTAGGRVIGVVLMFFGIGVLGLFTATVAGILVEQRLKKERGMGSYDFQDHIILCEWNERTREILRDLRADPRSAHSSIVLIADVEARPMDDENLHFIKGDVTEETLADANVKRAATVVIVGDRRLDSNARDAKVILSTLTVETLNRDVYTIAELAHEENARHCQRAHADEIIVGSEFSSRLISSATLDHGLTKVLSELLSSRFGHDLMTVPVPRNLVGSTFLEALAEMKQQEGMIILAVQHGRDGEVVTNPQSDLALEGQDRLVVISGRTDKAGA